MSTKKSQSQKQNKVINKEKNNKVFVNTKKLALIIVVAFLVLGFGGKVWNLILQPTDVVVIEKGTIEKTDTVIGYVLRNEKVLQGENYKNGIVQIKSEGEKVAKGNSIFRYYTNNEEEILEKIEELDIKYQKALDGETTIFSTDIKNLDRQINSLVEQISNTNNLSEIVEYKKQLNSIMNKKAKIVGKLSPSGSYIKEILSEKEKYEKQLDSESEYVKADISGVVSYKVDGYEEYFNVEDFSGLTEDQLDNINMKTGQLVATSSECGKIIDNFQCYIATSVDSDEASGAKIGDKVKIRLANTKETIAEIKYIKDAKNESKLIIFEIKNGVEYLVNYRKISIDIIWWSDSGLKVPQNSILKENNIDYVIRNRAGYTDKIPVKILRENGKFSLVDNYTTEELKNLGYTSDEIKAMSSISLYDEILLKPET